MYINQKIEIILSENQVNLISNQSRLAIKTYNLLLEKSIYMVSDVSSPRFIRVSKLMTILSQITLEKKYLNSLHLSTRKNIIMMVKRELEKKIKKPNYCIKFKTQKSSFFHLYFENSDIPNPIGKRLIKLPLGTTIINGKVKNIEMTLRLSQKVNLRKDGQILNYKIMRKYNRFYLIICIKHNTIDKIDKTGRRIAIDFNHKNFFVAIDNVGNAYEFRNLYQIKYFDRLVDDLKSKRSKSAKKSKFNKALMRIYNKRNTQTETILFSIANFLVKNYDIIAIGDYTVSSKGIKYREMRRKMLNQSIIGKFTKKLMYVSEKYDKRVLVTNEAFTTQTCHRCGTRRKITPEIRTYTCYNCNLKMHRDINSAVNIGKKANILSYSDYSNQGFPKMLYYVDYSICKQRLFFTKLK